MKKNHFVKGLGGFGSVICLRIMQDIYLINHNNLLYLLFKFLKIKL